MEITEADIDTRYLLSRFGEKERAVIKYEITNYFPQAELNRHLLRVVEEGDAEMVAFLLDMGANPNTSNSQAFRTARSNGWKEITENLEVCADSTHAE
jgi:hypothetical protein